MKKQIIIVFLVIMVFCLCTCAETAPVPRPDYLKMMTDAANSGSTGLGIRIERLRGLEPGDEGYVSFDELYLLSRYITAAFSNYRYSDELRFCAGELILNRMASPDYPDDMEAVMFQEDMYPGISKEELEKCTTPTKASIKTALRLLQGERMMENDVLTLTKVPKEEIYSSYYDELLGNLYFTHSSCPNR